MVSWEVAISLENYTVISYLYISPCQTKWNLHFFVVDPSQQILTKVL